MGSSNFGEPNLRIERSITSSSSPRKEKKSNNANKPKQPRRGLGVAQLEKIRLQTQLSHEAFYPYNLSQTTEFEILESESIRYGNPKSSTTSRWIPGNGMFESQQLTESSVPRHFLNLQVEEAEQASKKRNDSMASNSNQNSETTNYQELDLELRLSV